MLEYVRSAIRRHTLIYIILIMRNKMLPKLYTPTYEIELPISQKKVKFRPFLVKEQRNLLMALESNESSTIQQNIRDILTNCTITPGMNFDELPIIDVEYYFLNLRAKSVG